MAASSTLRRKTNISATFPGRWFSSLDLEWRLQSFFYSGEWVFFTVTQILCRRCEWCVCERNPAYAAVQIPWRLRHRHGLFAEREDPPMYSRTHGKFLFSLLPVALIALLAGGCGTTSATSSPSSGS